MYVYNSTTMFSNSIEKESADNSLVRRKYGTMLRIVGGFSLALSRLLVSDGVTSVSAQEKNPLPHATQGKDAPQKTIEELLGGEGLAGSIHGGVAEGNLFVLVHGKSLFDQERLAMIPVFESVRSDLAKGIRGQKLKVWGNLIAKATPQRHILVRKVELGEKWDPKVDFEFEDYPAKPIEKLSEELEKKVEVVGIVHAVLHDGKVVVIEIDGNKKPLRVNDPSFTKDLYRDDVVKVRYLLQSRPLQEPKHMVLDTSDPEKKKPVEVLDSIGDLNGVVLDGSDPEKKQIEGNLVWFPKSPFASRDVWGVRQMDVGQKGIDRFLAVINFADEEERKKVEEKCRKLWDEEKALKRKGFVRRGDGSSFFNRNIRIRINKGTVHVFSRNQGNPILDLKAEDIEVMRNEDK